VDAVVVRQPILDAGGQLLAYRLTSHAPEDSSQDSAESSDPEVQRIAWETLVDPVVERVTMGRGGIVEIARSILAAESSLPFTSHLVRVQVPSDGGPEGQLLEHCTHLKESGFSLVLGHSERLLEMAPHLELFDMVEVDFASFGPGRRKAVAAKMGDGAELIARHVEHWADLELAMSMGYQFFEGGYLTRPAADRGGAPEATARRQSALLLLREVNRPEFEIDAIEDVIKRDGALTLELLKYMNSAAFFRGNQIESIRHAVVLLGEREVRRWASMLSMARIGEGSPPELLTLGVLRARLGEQISQAIGADEHAGEAFLMGLVSILPSLTGSSIQDTAAELGLSDAIRSALLGDPGVLNGIHEAVLAMENTSWPNLEAACRGLGLPQTVLADLYLDAIAWTTESQLG